MYLHIYLYLMSWVFFFSSMTTVKSSLSLSLCPSLFLSIRTTFLYLCLSDSSRVSHACFHAAKSPWVCQCTLAVCHQPITCHSKLSFQGSRGPGLPQLLPFEPSNDAVWPNRRRQGGPSSEQHTTSNCRLVSCLILFHDAHTVGALRTANRSVGPVLALLSLFLSFFAFSVWPIFFYAAVMDGLCP